MAHEKFRARAREEALSHLAALLADLIAPTHSPVCLDRGASLKLEPKLVGLVRAFIEDTPVEPLSPEESWLVRGLEDETHRLTVASARERLEQLWPAPAPKGH
jgi:hypothetical protein